MRARPRGMLLWVGLCCLLVGACKNAHQLARLLHTRDYHEPVFVDKYTPAPGTCVSVQSGDDDFSTCARSIFPRFQSQNNQAAADNLGACLQGDALKEGLLIGHGNAGSIRTGGGDLETNKVIDGDVENDWKSVFATLRAARLTFFGCWTGASNADGDKGGALITKFKHDSPYLASVRAQNGVVFCNADSKVLYVEHNATWASADPSMVVAHGYPKLNPDPPEEVRVLLDDGSGGYEDIPVSHLKSSAFLRFQAQDRRPVKEAPGAKAYQTFPVEMQTVLHIFNFAQPFRPGIPDAERTGEFELAIQRQDSVENRRFWILSDTLLQDEDHPRVLYWIARDKLIALKTNLLNANLSH